MRIAALTTLVALLFEQHVSASEERNVHRLTLADAVALALSLDPLVAEASINHDRSQLAVLRSRLDQITIKIDAQAQGLWNESNIGGALLQYCATSTGPVQTDAATCVQLGGTLNTSPTQHPTYGQALGNLSALVTIPLITGYYQTANIARARSLERAGELSERQSRKDTALAVARAYWDIRRLSLSKESQVVALQRLIEAEGVIADRVKAGLAPALDLNRATARRLQQLARVKDLQGQLEEGEAQFGVTLGIRGTVVLVDAPRLPEPGPRHVEDAVRLAMQRRPELAAARLQLDAQHDAVRMAASSYYPQVNVFGLFQYGNNPYLTGSGTRATTAGPNPLANLAGSLTLGLSLSLNIFDTFNTYTSVKDARYVEMRLAQQVREAERNIDTDVRLATAQIDHLEEQRAPLIEARQVGADNLAILETQYRGGNALVIEVLDAAVDLANTEFQLADVTARLQVALLQRDAAMGAIVGVSL